MRIAAAFLTIFILCSGADAQRLRQTSRILEKFHKNYYYWTLAAIALYFQGNCDIGDYSASCSMPGYTADLIGEGNEPTAYSLKVCELQSGGDAKCKTYLYNGRFNANQIMFDAFPSLSKFDTLNYRLALYKLYQLYGGPYCDLTTNNRKTITQCSKSNSQSVLTGVGSDPTLVSLQNCDNNNCKNYNFDTRTNTRAILDEAFP
jgi:hypothetical protein